MDPAKGVIDAGLSLGGRQYGDRAIDRMVRIRGARHPLFWLGVVLILAGILLTQFATGPSRQELTQPAGGPRGESLSSRKLSSEGFSKNHAHGIE